MDSVSAQWSQEFGVTKSIAEAVDSPVGGAACARPALMEKKVARPPKDQALNCPRCHSTNTKFCYYNNYSLAQPRYFCKCCRRYWTEGGTLRNVPVGGGSRKPNKSHAHIPNGGGDGDGVFSFSTSTAAGGGDDQLPFSSQKLGMIPDLSFHEQNPKIVHHGQDLNLGFQGGGHHDYGHRWPQFLEFPKMEEGKGSPPYSSSSVPLSSLSLMRSNGNVPPTGINMNFFPDVAPAPGGILDHQTSGHALFGPGFLFQEFKSNLGCSIDGVGYASSRAALDKAATASGSLMFSLGETKRDSSTSGYGGDHDNQDKGSNENDCNRFWNGMLGEGGSW